MALSMVTVSPYVIVRNAAAAIRFYAKACNAEASDIVSMPDGRIGHCQLTIGQSRLYIADEFPEFEHIVGPESLSGTSVLLHMDVEELEGAFRRFVSAGATPVREPTQSSQGDRTAKVRDPFGTHPGWPLPPPAHPQMVGLVAFPDEAA